MGHCGFTRVVRRDEQQVDRRFHVDALRHTDEGAVFNEPAVESDEGIALNVGVLAEVITNLVALRRGNRAGEADNFQSPQQLAEPGDLRLVVAVDEHQLAGDFVFETESAGALQDRAVFRLAGQFERRLGDGGHVGLPPAVEFVGGKTDGIESCDGSLAQIIEPRLADHRRLLLQAREVSQMNSFCQSHDDNRTDGDSARMRAG